MDQYYDFYGLSGSIKWMIGLSVSDDGPWAASVGSEPSTYGYCLKFVDPTATNMPLCYHMSKAYSDVLRSLLSSNTHVNPDSVHYPFSPVEKSEIAVMHR